MGLDAVEIVMAVEDTFDIRLEDEETMRMKTPRDLIDAVFRLVAHSDSQSCLTHRAFNLLRATLRETLGLKRGQITPNALMDDLIPRRLRNGVWAQLATDLGTGAFPDLVRPHPIVAALYGVSLLAGAGAVFWLMTAAPSAGMGAGFCAFLISVATIGLVSWAVTLPLRTSFPPSIATVGRLSTWIMSHKSGLASPGLGKCWTREQVAARVREIVIEQLGCADSYHEDARFIEDLGLS